MKKYLAPLAASAVIGAAGFALIQTSEGTVYKPYRDVVGVVTVCTGHTGNDIVWGKRYSQAECNALLMADIAKHSPVITPGNPKNCIRNAPLNANQRDALISFTFNVGTGAFCKSTMARKLGKWDYQGASAEFPKWNKAGGRAYKGLTIRRAAERRLFDSYQRSEPRNTFSGQATALLMKLS